jgi:hypothetical protein
VFIKFHFSATLFVGCQIHFGKFYFLSCTMVVIPMKEVGLVVVVDDLDFGVRNVVFEAKVLNRCGTFDQIANRSMEDVSYAYLHYDLLDRETLTTIIFKIKSLHINMHEQYLQKCMFVRVKIFGIESKSKRVFEKGDMHVVIIVKSMTIVSPITIFELELVPMFFQLDSIREFISFFQSLSFATLVALVIG